MRLKRKIDGIFNRMEKSKNKMPLIVKGARQIVLTLFNNVIFYIGKKY